MMECLILSGLTIFVICVFIKWRQNYWTRKGFPQLNPNILFGDVKPMVWDKKSPDFFLDLYRKCKDLNYKEVGLYTGSVPFYMPIDYNLIKRILIKDFNYFNERGLYHHEQDYATVNLLHFEEKKWKYRRAQLVSFFSTGKLKKMCDTLIANGQLVNKIIARCEKENSTIDIKHVLERYTTDNIVNLAFGLDCNSLNEPENELLQMGIEMFEPQPLKRMLEFIFPPALLVKFGHRMYVPRVYTYFPKVLQTAIEEHEKPDNEKNDLLQLMLQLKKEGKLSEDNENNNSSIDPALNSYKDNAEIISESLLMFAVGFESSSSVATFVIYELAYNQKIQDKLRNEVNLLLEKENGNVTYESINSMEYLDKVVKETLRKNPVVPVVTRKCVRDYKLEGSNKIIKKGTIVVVPFIGLHHDPDFFPNPDEFNPENFSYENESLRPKGVYFPFGDGPRICLAAKFGMLQTKVALVYLIKDFRITLDKSVKYPQTLDSAGIVAHFKQKILLKATKL